VSRCPTSSRRRCWWSRSISRSSLINSNARSVLTDLNVFQTPARIRRALIASNATDNKLGRRRRSVTRSMRGTPISKSGASAATRTRLSRSISCGARRQRRSTSWNVICGGRTARRWGLSVQAEPSGGATAYQDFGERSAVVLVAGANDKGRTPKHQNSPRSSTCLRGYQGDTGYPIPSRIGHKGATIWPHRRFPW
jgi:hypothetical protein